MSIPASTVIEPALEAKSTRSRRGFAAMDQALQREIASRGGLAVHRSGRAHRFTSGEAQEAGRKGGQAVSRDSEHMARIGSRGGRSRRLRAEARAEAESALT